MDYDSNKPEEAGSTAEDFRTPKVTEKEEKEENESKERAEMAETGVNEGGFICPNCGSKNTHKWAEYDGPDDYIWEYWCDDCKENLTP
ncbi:hypothetical protein M0R04_10445 [Candidatus Dojkabacteria bacterium]|jgi:hypothetical protein|nr:hypothetical protein [Candidatus Dojkabacteria bacterium]